MQHLTLDAKATTTITDEGEATLLVSTYDLDRGGDVIERGAFAKTIERWRASSKLIALHWNHEGDPASIIGSVDPASMRETDAGLVVVAQLDLEESEKAREAWKLVKRGVLGASFGYLATESHERSDGVRVISEIDLLEVSLTPSPMNDQTRVIDWKQVRPDLAAEAPWSDVVLVERDPEADPIDRKADELMAIAEKSARRREPVEVATFPVVE